MTTKHLTADLIPTFNCATFQHNSNVFHLKALSVCKKNHTKQKQSNKQTNSNNMQCINVLFPMVSPKWLPIDMKPDQLFEHFYQAFVLWFCILLSFVKLFSCSDLLSEQVLFSSRLFNYLFCYYSLVPPKTSKDLCTFFL